MALVPYVPFELVARDENGQAEDGAKLWFFLYDTTTPVTVYQTPSGTAHTHPVVADSEGAWPAIYWDNEIRTRVKKTGSAAVNANNPDWQVLDLGEVSDFLERDLSNLGTVSEEDAEAFREAIGAAAASDVYTPEQFGAVGDGGTDDYAALKAMADAVTSDGGGIVRFGKNKTYYIAQIDTSGAAVFACMYDACVGLDIDMNGSTISVNGAFNRPDISTRNSVIPFRFRNCSKLTLRNGTINQNVSDMTQAPAILEAFAHGITLEGCQQVQLTNITSMESSVDGIIIQSDVNQTPQKVCRNVTLTNCKFLYNARQGLSLVGCNGFTADNCDFSQTGQAAGSYGNVAPSAGVDIEPDAQPPTTDSITTNCVFNNCRFDENVGNPFVVLLPNSVGTVRLTNCSAIGDDTTAFGSIMDISSANFLMEGFVGDNVGVRIGLGILDATVMLTNMTFRDCLFSGSYPDFVPISQSYTIGPKALYENIECKWTSTTAKTSAGTNLLTITGSNTTVRDMRLTAPATLYQGAGASNNLAVFLNCRVEDIRLTTDMTDVGKIFAIEFDAGGANAAKITSDDITITNRIGPMIYSGSATWDPGSVADGDQVSTTLTVVGASLGDYVDASFSLTLGGLGLVAYVSALNTVTVGLLNNTGGAVDLASGTVKAKVRKP